MRKKILFVAMTIALATVVLVGCQSKPKLPAGTPIGKLFLIEKDRKVFQLADSMGNIMDVEYTSVVDSTDYLVAENADGIDLITPEGRTFAHCVEFSVIPNYRYRTEELPIAGSYIKTINNRGLCSVYLSPKHEGLIKLQIWRDDMVVLDNGYALYQAEGYWGIIKRSEPEPIHASNCQEITVITTEKGKTYFWINSPVNGIGILDWQGNAVKPFSEQQMKNLKNNKKTTVLWEEGALSAIVVPDI